ncbi:MAG: FAD-dependent oxidoreductase [Pseudomonadota bacterium]
MIVIIGAGIAGLSLGWALVQRGADVTIVDAGPVAGQASGVATSYLEPRLGTTPIRAVERAAHAAWPHYAAELEDASEMDVAFRADGQIRVALAETVTKFDNDIATRLEQGWTVDRLSPDDARAMAPALSQDLAAAAFVPGISWVDGGKVFAALARLIRTGGHEIREYWPVAEIVPQGNGFVIKSADGSTFTAQKTILCTGLGNPALLGLPPEIKPTRPVRGVNLVLDQSRLSRPFQHLVKHHRGNICPRPGGELLVGTTFEPGETNLEAEDAVIEKLYAHAETVFPTVRDLPLKRVTTGIRAKIGDGNLFVGESATMPGLFYSLSHAGAGYLRAPVVSREMAGFVLEGPHGPLTGFLTGAR